MRTALIVTAIALTPSILLALLCGLAMWLDVRRAKRRGADIDVIGLDELARLRATHTFSNSN